METILHTSLKKVSNVGQSQFSWNIFINNNDKELSLCCMSLSHKFGM